MQTVIKKKTWDSNRFRQAHMTCWPRTHPVALPHLQTDHWTKMKTMVPDYISTMPTTLLKKTEANICESMDKSTLPRLKMDGNHQPDIVLHRSSATPSRPKTSSSVYSTSHYRNVYNDRARLGFCYWLIEKKAPKCKVHNFGAYKTYLGLPKV